MERYIGIDVHASSCTVAVISEAGKKLKDFPVETNGQALVERWRHEYNTFRPHSSLGYRPPAPETIEPKTALGVR